MTWLLAKGTGKPLLEKDIGDATPRLRRLRPTHQRVRPAAAQEAPRPDHRGEDRVKTIKEGEQGPRLRAARPGRQPRAGSARCCENGPVVLFWYPIASSGGCTQQACHFRDLASEFSAAGAQRFGISTDPVSAQKAFAETNALRLPAAVRRVGRGGPVARREAEVHHPGEASHVRHRPRPDDPQGDHLAR